MKKRNAGIDLLRLVLMYMVCMLHVLLQGGILNNCQPGTNAHRAFWLMEVFAFCAVDGFALISGYTASDRPVKYGKIVEMWFQAVFYSFVVTVGLIWLGIGAPIGKRELLHTLMPVTYNKFWYFTAYFALFFAIPVLNKYLFALEEKSARRALVGLIFLYSVLGIVDDPFRSYGGYSAIWLMVLYCIGALAKGTKLFKKVSVFGLLVLWAGAIGVTWGLYILKDNKLLISYISPTILLCGMLMVELFSRLPLQSPLISKLSGLAFGIYLLQVNQVVWFEVIGGRFAPIAGKRILVGVPLALGGALCVFVAGLAVEWVRSLLMKLVRIDRISRGIAKAGERAVDGISKLIF